MFVHRELLYGAQAVRLLRQALKKGYRLKDLSKNDVFSPLRSRADFKMLVIELDALDRN